MENILIFGTGTVSEFIFNQLDFCMVNVLAFVNSETFKSEFHGYKIINPSEIVNYKYDYILIASGYVENIIRQLEKYGIDRSKIVSFIFDEKETYNVMSSSINKTLSDMYNRNKIYEWVKNPMLISNIFPAVFWYGDQSVSKIEKDFVREQTIKLVANSIKKQKLEGNIAELGVYRGDFTVVLAELFEEKVLYLYDTFEGFSVDDVNKDESIINKVGENEKFKDTSVEYVINRLKPHVKTVVNKGYFPDTFKEDVGEFCFVSIDLNLYNPVKSALNLFYPHMVDGGIIFVSDYNAPFYSGSQKAVDEFCNENHKYPIPVADFYGSVMIIKEPC